MKVAVFGGGYAGVTLTRALERRLDDDVDLVLVDDTGEHLVQHELHRAVRIPSITDEIVIDLKTVTDRARICVDEVESIDADAGYASLANGSIEYDVGAVCLGAETNYHDIPGVETHGLPLKRVEHATDVRDSFLGTLDRAEGVTRDDAGSADRPHAIVGGAGLSGIQVAGELAALASERGFDGGTDLRISLLEQEDRVAPRFPENFQTAVREQLEARGIDVLTGRRVAGATGSTVELDDGTVLDYETFVWTGGICGPSSLGGTRPRVDGRLRLSGNTFVVGDAAAVVDRDGQAVPPSAQSAVRAAKVAAENVERLVEYERTGGQFRPRLEQFGFDSPGWLVSIGDGAVAQVGPTVLTGTAAVAMKTTVGAGYLSSVGAIEQAVDLVNDELGLDVHHGDN